MIPELERRRIATEKTLQRFRKKSFDWKAGKTCAHLAKYHLKNMGHKPPTVPRFNSAARAKKALSGLGFDSMTALLDSILPRIKPAEMVLGDIAVVPGEAGMDAVLICAGPRRLFGWHGSEDKAVFIGVNLNELTGAWRA